MNRMRRFETGATRDGDEGKYDYEGFLSPLVIECFGAYMHKHRMQADGELRDSDNWQKGIPFAQYMKSGWRHFFDWWMLHRGHDLAVNVPEACCALIFNVQGYLHEYLKAEADISKLRLSAETNYPVDDVKLDVAPQPYTLDLNEPTIQPTKLPIDAKSILNKLLNRT